MDEIEVRNNLKGYSNKKTERVIKSPAFSFRTTIWSYLSHSWSGINYICKAKYKTVGYV